MKNIKIIFLLIIVFSLINCERKLDSKDPVRPYPSDLNSPQSLQAVLNDASVTLSWDISDPASVEQYIIYAAENEPVQFKKFDSTANQTIDLNDLKLNRLYFFEVSAVYEGVESNPSVYVSAQAAHISIRINNGDLYTNNRNVQIQFTAPSTAAYVIISEDPLFSDAQYQSYASTKTFLIDSDNDGTKTVYAKVQFSDGGETGDILTDDIVLDSKVWIDSVFFRPTQTVFGPGDTILFGLNSGESDGAASVIFSGGSNIVLLDDGLAPDNTASDGIYYGWYIVPIDLDLYNVPVAGNFIDRAGNKAMSVTSSELLNVNSPSQPVTVTGYLNAAKDSVVFNWTRSSESDFVSYRLMYDTNSPNVDINDDVQVDIYSSGTTSYKAEAILGTTYYRVFIIDKHGDAVGSNTVQIIK